jgi:hypothetical protein
VASLVLEMWSNDTFWAVQGDLRRRFLFDWIARRLLLEKVDPQRALLEREIFQGYNFN